MRAFGLIFVILFSLSTQAADPFERRLFFPAGSRYENEQLDLETVRNLIELNAGEIVAYGFASSRESIDSRFYYVANFRHKEKYWVAKIPKTGVQSSIFQFQNLSSLAKRGIPVFVLNWLRAGHVQARLQMKANSPIELRTQDPTLPLETALVRDFTYSLNAVRSVLRKESAFNPSGDGLSNGYGTSHNFISTEDSILNYRRADLNVEQYRMTLTPAQSDKLLATYVGFSVSGLETRLYSTATKSCVTYTMQGIYTAVSNKPVIWWGRFWRNQRLLRQSFGSSFENNPRAVVALLTKQGYITEKSRLPNLEKENFQP